MQWVLDNEEKLGAFKDKAQSRILDCYTWEKISNRYEMLFFKVYNGDFNVGVKRFFGLEKV